MQIAALRPQAPTSIRTDCQRAPKFPQKWAVKFPGLAVTFGIGDQP